MINFDRLEKLKDRMYGLIDREIARVGHHKSYEGALSYHMSGRFSDDSPYWELHCYVCPVIDGRSYVFYTLDDLEKLLDKWELVDFDEENEQYVYPKEIEA